ncbi:hypothetical protein PENTCL1PPCAC_2888 [Pristionchus entomophagus]|uniref:Uncharacterized protein n=1 Tax=Pristionchus entomophagus TaxID=358040 RepID=A0AAV5SJ93_9BILA|nr:hypothetical protein PENTCL1PPCAC_2888 [Pristionchus entomophagus]
MPRWSLRLGWPPSDILLFVLFLTAIASSIAQHLPIERPTVPRFHGGSSSSSSISAVTGVSHYDDPPVSFGQHTVKCYSCMSSLYGAIWENHLAFLYKKPRNFTNTCDNIAVHPEGVPAVHCTSICLSMSEESNIAGARVKTHIRGCMSDLLINGFNTTIVQWYRWLHRDSCRMYRKKELFKLPGDFNDDSMIEVCTCYDNNCNGTNSSSFPSSSLALLLLLSLLHLLRL